jgi:hypothetical protein
MDLGRGEGGRRQGRRDKGGRPLGPVIGWRTRGMKEAVGSRRKEEEGGKEGGRKRGSSI